MIIVGYMMYKHTPKSINWVYGYRTSRSMKNMDTWNFAHDRCGRLWVKYGCVLLALSIIAQLPFMKSFEDTIGTMTLILLAVQLIALLTPIYFVEKALKENFDENGKRILKS